MLERSFSLRRLEYKAGSLHLPRPGAGLPLYILLVLLLPAIMTGWFQGTAGQMVAALPSLSSGERLSETSAVATTEGSTALQGGADPRAELDPVERWRSEGFVFVLAGQEWDAGSLAIVDQALALVSPSVRTRLGNDALGPMYITVNRSGRTAGGAQPYGGPANFYSTNDGRNELVLFPGQSLLTVLHELGHAFNLRDVPAASYAGVLIQPEMQSFMAATGWQVVTPVDKVRTMRDQAQVAYAYEGTPIWSGLSQDNPLEDFANSFALYFASPESLKQLSPPRFDWFERFVGR